MTSPGFGWGFVVYDALRNSTRFGQVAKCDFENEASSGMGSNGAMRPSGSCSVRAPHVVFQTCRPCDKLNCASNKLLSPFGSYARQHIHLAEFYKEFEMLKPSKAELDSLEELAEGDTASQTALGVYIAASADLETARDGHKSLIGPEATVEDARRDLYRTLGEQTER